MSNNHIMLVIVVLYDNMNVPGTTTLSNELIKHLRLKYFLDLIEREGLLVNP